MSSGPSSVLEVLALAPLRWFNASSGLAPPATAGGSRARLGAIVAHEAAAAVFRIAAHVLVAWGYGGTGRAAHACGPPGRRSILRASQIVMNLATSSRYGVRLRNYRDTVFDVCENSVSTGRVSGKT